MYVCHTELVLWALVLHFYSETVVAQRGNGWRHLAALPSATMSIIHRNMYILLSKERSMHFDKYFLAFILLTGSVIGCKQCYKTTSDVNCFGFPVCTWKLFASLLQVLTWIKIRHLATSGLYLTFPKALSFERTQTLVPCIAFVNTLSSLVLNCLTLTLTECFMFNHRCKRILM